MVHNNPLVISRREFFYDVVIRRSLGTGVSVRGGRRGRRLRYAEQVGHEFGTGWYNHWEWAGDGGAMPKKPIIVAACRLKR